MTTDDLLLILSDGRFHSGEAIAQQLNTTRASIWKYIKQLRSLGADIYSVKGKGYRIPGGLELLDQAWLTQALKSFTQPENIHVVTSIASTNQFLLNQTSNPSPQICVAEYQSSGRGRLGRNWHSPFARNIYLSMRQTLPLPIDALSGLSLAVGCRIADALTSLGAMGVQLKWPNDLRVNGRKLGGVLVEIAGQSDSGCELVIGLGLNWDMSEDSPIDQHWQNLKPLVNSRVSRNHVVATLCKALAACLTDFSQFGFSHFKADWEQLDEFKNKPVVLLQGNKKTVGVSRGVDTSGALLLEKDGSVMSFIGGEVSLRLLT
ncbi:bifunctional biotin--[acetyl-CoA-carboxylase] ligase/biotin operon repressor BirA [Pleionea mediterranea]|uniref:Bifunctional ligase/repressor BirA n=1 Tax=Pleionea mediterranea TaxID=523701 RepID=A0A316FZT9_9GAMM|nr:bifunctional biotin--[acetyl-CoA-carboxylase] ligase/biotin operon repressor BirA [Pleionea mediterranea]PWK54161.1 BirA family biotin operon repressor/biotin-[acetyl-CoA-carboxylase] ligase [Pleionea mediterranea]